MLYLHSASDHFGVPGLLRHGPDGIVCAGGVRCRRRCRPGMWSAWTSSSFNHPGGAPIDWVKVAAAGYKGRARPGRAVSPAPAWIAVIMVG
jgi:hypothetical protein